MPRVTSLAGIPMSITLTRPAYSRPGGITSARLRPANVSVASARMASRSGAPPSAGRPAGMSSEITGRADEPAAAVAAFAADHDDTTRARRTLRGREPGEHGLGGAASGILHQRRAGDPQVADRALVDPAHLLASDDREHGSAPYRQRGGLGQEVGEDHEVWLPRIDARDP